jgi:hypothetical protein
LFEIDDQKGLLELKYMLTEELVADTLTKLLMGWKFQYLVHKLLGWNIEFDSDVTVIAMRTCVENHMLITIYRCNEV